MAITNNFIGEYVTLSQNSLDGYKTIGFDVKQLTRDMEQRLFTIKTNMSIPMSVYGDFFQWEKHGHHILPLNLLLTRKNKVGLHQTFCGSLIEFLHTDLDGNLSFILNPLTASKHDDCLLTLFIGL
jgi:hypothetical protein